MSDAPEQSSAWRAIVRVLRSRAEHTRDVLRWDAMCGPLQQPFHDISSVIVPAPCRVCGAPLLRLSTVPVCDACVGRIQPQKDALCPLCGELLGLEDWLPAAQAVCEMCRLAVPPFVCAVAWSAYEGAVREMLHLLKFDGVRSVAAPLGEKLAGAIGLIERGAPREMTVIAVPLHPARTRQRGYNQSVLMAEAALRILRREYPAWRLTAAHEALQRHRATEILYPLTAAARREMLRGAFRCVDAAAIAGKTVLLVDDIMTTGTTARECSTTLLKAGAKQVYVATLARAQKVTTAQWSEIEVEDEVVLMQ